MLNVVEFHDLSNLSFKMGTTIRDNLLGYPMLTNDVILYKSSHILGFEHEVGGRFHSLGKVVNCHQDVFVSIRGLRSYSSNHIYALD